MLSTLKRLLGDSNQREVEAAGARSWRGSTRSSPSTSSSRTSSSATRPPSSAAVPRRRIARQPAARGLRGRPRGVAADAGPAPLRRAAHRRLACCTTARSPRCGRARARRWWRPCRLSERTRRQGRHLVTVNDYLARRDAQWMGRSTSWPRRCTRRRLHSEHDLEHCGLRSRSLRGGHHLRHEQRVRLRLPARQHGRATEHDWCSGRCTTRSSTRSTTF